MGNEVESIAIFFGCVLTPVLVLLRQLRFFEQNFPRSSPFCFVGRGSSVGGRAADFLILVAVLPCAEFCASKRGLERPAGAPLV